MTPEQKIKHLILMRDRDLYPDRTTEVPVTPDDIDRIYDQLADAGEHWGAMNEVREGNEETGLECGWSRNYESKAVAAQYVDGSWVGWTYWYGGGKHGDPEAIDWIDEAYDLSCVEEQKTITARTFAKADPA